MANTTGTSEAATTEVRVKGTEDAKVRVYPPHYWEYDALKLYYNGKGDCSIDNNAAAAYKKKATAPLTYVTELQSDLITLGYLTGEKADGYYGGKSQRSVLRFQRHAKRVYRMKGGKPDDVSPSEAFAGKVDGICDAETAKEIRKWIEKEWKIPVGRFPATPVVGGKLREDAAVEWNTLVATITALGGTLEGPYGDTLRPLRKTSKVGTSGYSFHYCGRAVDINQNLGNKRYFCTKDPSGEHMYWRIWCLTALQDGSQGVRKEAGDIKAWDFGGKKEYKNRAGYYLDLTSAIESNSKFRRIKSQRGWENSYNKTEWWHFQYSVDIQETFQDELELVGFTEDDIRGRGWSTDAELDHKPG